MIAAGKTTGRKFYEISDREENTVDDADDCVVEFMETVRNDD